MAYIDVRRCCPGALLFRALKGLENVGHPGPPQDPRRTGAPTPVPSFRRIHVRGPATPSGRRPASRWNDRRRSSSAPSKAPLPSMRSPASRARRSASHALVASLSPRREGPRYPGGICQSMVARPRQTRCTSDVLTVSRRPPTETVARSPARDNRATWRGSASAATHNSRTAGRSSSSRVLQAPWAW